ncbi:MAG: SUMF1/EgtB/PvdO family nonheme iron enzyme [Amaricoccus sp.]
MRPLLLGLALLATPPDPARAELVLPQPDERLTQDCADCPPLVTLPDGSLISQAPVTRAQFAVFARETGFDQPGWGCKWRAPGIAQQDDHPVVCVSFQDATAYATWLSHHAGHAYRLPTVAEMQKAALGGQDGPYWWGGSVGRNRANCLGCGSAFDGKGTSPVTAFAKNPYHLLDAVGNVWIWTTDCAESGCDERRLIGGSWSNPPADLRVTKTIWNGTAIPFATYGIRVLREAD